MKKGIVKFFNETKGFGFIKEENGTEILGQTSGVTEQIRENDEVFYEAQQGKKGPNAVNVKIAR